MPSSLELKAFAKINLGLNVFERLETGYHRVDMIMQAIALCDNINVGLVGATGSRQFNDFREIKLNITGNVNDIPVDKSNLAYKAAKLFLEKAEIVATIDIKIEKNIPSSAGLAGGSTDAAAVLLALDFLFKTNLGLKKLADMGAILGADVAFCIYADALGNDVLRDTLSVNDIEMASTCMRAQGIGEVLAPLKPVELGIILFKPELGISTKEVYEGIDGTTLHHVDVEKIIEGLETGELEKLYNNAGNDLEQYSVFKYNEIKEIKQLVSQRGRARLVLMSGSGPTVYALYDSEEKLNEDFTEIKSENNMLILKTYSIR